MTEMNQEPNVEETKVQDVKAAETEEVQENAEVETVVTEQGEAAVKPKNKFVASLDNFFQISARQSSFRAEIVGGVTTFFAMCYILFVNPSSMIGYEEGAIYDALRSGIFIGTAIGAIIGTLLMALLARMPYAQAPGMGLNAFFCSVFMAGALGGSIVDGVEAQYQAGLAVIFVAGLLFLLISLTGLREKIAKAIPMGLKKAISAGIGLFIAYIGFQNAGVIVANPYTVSALGNLNIFSAGATYSGATWYSISPILISFITLLIMGILRYFGKNNKIGKVFANANVIIAIVAGTLLYYLFNIGNAEAFQAFTDGLSSPITAFENFGNYSIGRGFLGFQYWTADVALDLVILIITFCLIDMFDTLGTLQGTATEAGLLDENGVPQKIKECLWSDSIATVAGAVVGTSTVTTFVESASGVSAGARTGFSSLVVAFLFIIAMFLSPLAEIIPSAATSAALVYVGVLMLGNIKDIDFKDMTITIPAFLIVIMMPLSYSISNGIGIGLIAYTILKFFKVLTSGKEGIKAYYGFETVELTEEEKAERAAKNKKAKDTKKVYGEFLGGDLLILVISLLFVLRFLMTTV